MYYVIRYSLTGEVKGSINYDDIITDTIVMVEAVGSQPLFTNPEDLEMNQRRREVNLGRSIAQNLQRMIFHEENRLTDSRNRFKTRKY